MLSPVSNKVKEQKAKTVHFSLTNRRKSSTSRKGEYSNGNRVSENLDSAASFRFPIACSIKRKDGNGMVRMQWIPNAPTIYVDDLVDETGKVIEQGLLSRGWTEEKIRESRVLAYRRKDAVFKFGELHLSTDGENAELVRYLKECSFHVDGQNFIPNKANIYHFKTVDAEKVSEKELGKKLGVETQVKEFLKLLAAQVGKQWHYDVERIDAIVDIFNLGSGIKKEDYASKTLAIVSFAESNPMEFLEIYNSKTKLYNLHIAQAKEMMVIEIKDKKVSFVDSKKTFLELKGRNDDERTEELVSYFLTKGGTNDYETMVALLDIAKKKSLS